MGGATGASITRNNCVSQAGAPPYGGDHRAETWPASVTHVVHAAGLGHVGHIDRVVVVFVNANLTG
jgi:hypothetical protein